MDSIIIMNAAQNTTAMACNAPPTANIYWKIIENPRYISKKYPTMAKIMNNMIAIPIPPLGLSGVYVTFSLVK
jgi:hypothetical protein